MFSAFCMFFKYHSPSRGEGCGLLRRYAPRNDAERNNIAFKGLDVVRQYAVLLERRVQRGTRARKALVVTRQTNLLGRSMIEMLGVLAIIAVLTVGGIAGYSKAMEMWKINKLTEEYSMLIFGMMSHIDDARKLTVYREGEFGDTTYMNDVAEAESLIPPTWTKNDTRGTRYVTELGNLVGIMSRNSKLTIELGFYNYEAFAADAMSPKFCQSIYDKIIVPLNSSLYVAEKYNNGLGTISNYYGYDYCANGKKCIKSLTPVQIKTLCKNCNVDRCSVVIRF